MIESQYKHLTQSLELGFNTANQQKVQDGLSLHAKVTAFGKPTETALLDMKTRVLAKFGEEDNE